MSQNATNLTTTVQVMLTTLGKSPTTRETPGSTQVPTVLAVVPTSTVVELASWFPFMFLALFIVTYNGLIIVAFISDGRLWKGTANALIANQAITDLLYGTIAIPFYSAKQYEKDYGVTTFVLIFCLLLSIIGQFGQAVERLIAVFQPEILKKASKAKFGGLVVCTWLLSLLLVSIIAIFWWKPESERNDGLMAFMLFVWVVFIVCFVAEVGIYIQVHRKARQITKQKRKQLKSALQTKEMLETQKEIASVAWNLQVTKLSIAVLGLTALTYIPAMFYEIAEMAKLGFVRPPGLLQASMYLIVFRSVLCPFFTLSLKKDIRSTVMKLLGGHSGKVSDYLTDSY